MILKAKPFADKFEEIPFFLQNYKNTTKIFTIKIYIFFYYSKFLFVIYGR